MSSGNTRIDTPDAQGTGAEAAEAIYRMIRDSFELAIRGLPMVSPQSVQEVLDTVDDAVTNHLDDLACVTPVGRGQEADGSTQSGRSQSLLSGEPNGHVALAAFSDDDVATAYGLVVGAPDPGEVQLPAATLAYVRERRAWLERKLDECGQELLEELLQESLTRAAWRSDADIADELGGS